MTYTINTLGGITRDADGAFIPTDPENSDYQAYLAWMQAGNTATQPAAPSQAEVVAKYSAALQRALDSYAMSWGYDSIVSAASYAASTVDKFKNEATVLISWRDATWSWAEQFQEEVAVGTATLPSDVEAFLALMPQQPARPSW